MIGTLTKMDNGWMVMYQVINSFRSLPLHPDDLWAIDHNGQILGIIQEVEFEMVEVLTDDITIYAKLIDSKK
jgi:hypothetical protein